MTKLAVIAAAGLGSRLGSITSDKPKGFLMIDGESLIERSINNLIDIGVERILIGTGYLSKIYEQFAASYDQIICIKNNSYRSTGSMATLFNMHEFIDNDFLFLESDLLYGKDALDYLISDSRKNLILASGKTNSNDEVYIESNKLNHLVKMSKNKNELINVFGELVGISKISLNKYNQMCGLFKSNQCSNKIDYEHVMSMASSHSSPFFIKKIEDLAWCEIDNTDHLAIAKNKIIHIINKKKCNSTK